MAMTADTLDVTRVGALREQPPETRWLVRSLWPRGSVAVIGGQPKTAKSHLGLDLATSVASGTPFLGRFPIDSPGPALVYLAEDGLPDVRDRVQGLCEHRGLDLAALDLHVITEPSLWLDQDGDRGRLRQTAEQLRPRLLVLDPLVRLHNSDENSSREVSALLGYLRKLQREFELSVVLVHHTSKKHHSRPGQGLRGSGDLHAWLDVGAYLAWSRGRLQLTLEQRAAPSPDPLQLVLTSSPTGAGAHLAILEAAAETEGLTLTQRIVRELREAGGPLRRTDLRQRLRLNNSKLGGALEELVRLEILVRSAEGWRLPDLQEADHGSH